VTWKAGVSGNPSGRPKSDIAGLAPTLLKTAPKILDMVIKAALDGDMTAAKMVIERVYPALKATTKNVVIPIGVTLEQSSHNIICSTLDGKISPDTALVLLNGLSSHAQLISLSEISERLDRLENIKK
jgi:hypothetical protein